MARTISDNRSDNMSDYVQKETLKEERRDIISQHDLENKSDKQFNDMSKEDQEITINGSVSNGKTEESNVIENGNILNQVNKNDNLLDIYEKEQKDIKMYDREVLSNNSIVNETCQNEVLEGILKQQEINEYSNEGIMKNELKKDEDNQSENSIEYESGESQDYESDKSHRKKRKYNETVKHTYDVEESIEQHTCDHSSTGSCKARNCNGINDEEIINFLKSNDKNVYRKYLKNLLVCDKKCSIENHSEEKDLFLKRVQKLCSLIKNKKFNYKYTDYWKKKVHFKCCKLQRAYNIFIIIIFSIVKEIKNLTKELNEMSNFIFINSGIETYLNECNISLVQKRKEHNDIINNYFNENNIINSFFFKKYFCKEEKKKKKKYISYIPLHNYKILFLCLQEIFNDKNIHDKLEKISYYIEFDDTNILPNYCNSFYKHFKINEMYLYHIQSLYNDSVPTIPCLNMFISCMNYNYGKIHKKKSLFKYELNNTHLSTLPYVYCCDIQLIKYFEFLKLKETCYKIIKNNKIYDNFLSHLSSYIFDDSYFIIPFFTSYGKFLIIIKTNKNIDNLQQSMDTLKNKNSITYDVIINSFVFPNDSSFQAIIHFSHIFINTLKNLFKTRNSDEDIPDITFENLLNVDKKRLIYHEIESNKNKRHIIMNMIFLIESFFNNTEKTRIPKEFDEGLRFLYVIRLLEFFHEKKEHQC
ncbi:hypothetical protein PFBG_04089 [Plasmodium falciparum 7G8]|uniref:Uncharacterized protein n=1 Tax=Plasmodium falciparum (isolate 7G8) TaxID=57266 RepID=W7FIQ8_PLAF8|nr:hypothetical protein PFBG_04089 [Plasmodium falciparum 7G8]